VNPRILPAAIILLAGALPIHAADPTYSTDVRVVNVFATVRNARGKIVPNLNSDDFVLDEDGRPQTIRYFTRESGLPLTLGLLIDTSLSQRHVLGQEKSASSDFFKQILREDTDQAFLINFDRDVDLLQDLTTSRVDLQSSLRSLDAKEPKQGRWVAAGSPGVGRYGGTALYDAIFLASNELMRPPKGRRKALIVLSDGVDIGSHTKLPDAIQAAQRADTLVYALLFADESFYGDRATDWRRLPDGRAVLRQISAETGGGFFEVSEQQSVETIYRRIQEELRNQYSIGYVPDPAAPAAGFRAIHLTTRDPHLTVQARTGYYAPR
jgi:VWFA-related protein